MNDGIWKGGISYVRNFAFKLAICLWVKRNSSIYEYGFAAYILYVSLWFAISVIPVAPFASNLLN